MLEILDAYTEPLRSFMAADFYATRKAMDLTQMEMADILDIDLRSYSSLEHGESLCSTWVFLRYILHFKKDRAQFMESIENVFKKADSHMSKESGEAKEECIVKILNAVRRFFDVAMYRRPLQVRDKRAFLDGCYAVCPRCRSTLPRDYMHYCDRCGQYLSWDRF